MAPRRNFQLARIFGIRVGVGVSWFVVLFLFIFVVTPVFHDELGGSRTTAYLVAVASVLSFFASLVLHELGHALVARLNGLHVADHGWTLQEIELVLFIRALVDRGRIVGLVLSPDLERLIPAGNHVAGFLAVAEA